MEIPESMRAELGEWNNGAGIDLESWVGCQGRFSLAVGYASLFWPDFIELNGYIFRRNVSLETLAGFENQENATRQSVEAVINHLHLTDIQYYGCPDCSSDKLLILGRILQEIYTTKLGFKFPERPCTVEFYIPDDPDNFDEYQLTFWQKAHESPSA